MFHNNISILRIWLIRLSLRCSLLPTSKFQIAPFFFYILLPCVNYVHFMQQFNLYTTPQRPYIHGWIKRSKERSQHCILGNEPFLCLCRACYWKSCICGKSHWRGFITKRDQSLYPPIPRELPQYLSQNQPFTVAVRRSSHFDLLSMESLGSPGRAHRRGRRRRRRRITIYEV